MTSNLDDYELAVNVLRKNTHYCNVCEKCDQIVDNLWRNITSNENKKIAEIP